MAVLRAIACAQMVGLVTRLDGVRFAVFHMEQQTEWEYRWRMVSGEARRRLPEAYYEWRPAKVVGKGGVDLVQPELPGCVVEVEWRAGAGAGEWSQAALLLLARGRCRMRLVAKESVELAAGEHGLLAMVRGEGVGRYDFSGAVRLAAGEAVEVIARADAAVLANVLFRPGEFRVWSGSLEAENVGASEGSWIICGGGGGGRLEAAMLERPRMWAQGPVVERE